MRRPVAERVSAVETLREVTWGSTGITGVSFAQAWKGRKRVRLGPHVVGFLGRREFIANKRAAGRAKDVADLALLAEARPRSHRTARSSRRLPRR